MKEVFAAHIKDSRIQTVEEHCKNVSEYAAQNGKKVGLESTLRLAGLLHDIGKQTNSFNDYIRKAVLDSSYIKRINHSSAGGRFLYECIEKPDDIESVAIQLIAYAIVSHHGLTDQVSLSGENIYKKRIYPEIDNKYGEVINEIDFVDYDRARAKFSDVKQEIDVFYKKISDIAEKMSLDDYSITFFLFGCLQRLILSCLVDADWRDTAEFIDDQRIKRLSIDELSVKWNEYSVKLERKIKSFDSTSNISKLRHEMSDLCHDFASYGNGIYRLSIPTGGGKTLAGMRYALELARKEKKDHIFYIAPFLSILEQNASEYKKIFEDDENILEYHSNVVSEDNEYDQKGSLSVDWSEAIIMTTMVQFLNSMFSGDMKSVRKFHQLANSVVIIDEAQSIPVKCLSMFNSMMNFMSSCCNTTVVICTATQPLFERIDKKLLYSSPADIIGNMSKFTEGFKRTELVNYSEKKISSQDLAKLAVDILDESALIILNTKPAVEKLYEELRRIVDENTVLFQLTTYMCAAHRMAIIEKIKVLLKEKNRKVICVSTQLIEAGVDVSFQAVIRSIAGLDSIAQAAGRCNRNAEMAKGIVYIVDYAEESLSKLYDIRQAQDATRLVMYRHHGDLLSDKAMELYYKEYYFKRKDEMDYNIRKINNTLFDLLSYNSNTQASYDYPLSQAYRSAGELFSVIEKNDTIGLIVPYGKAIGYIEELRETRSVKEAGRLLKLLQRYTVNVYRTDNKLKSLFSLNAVSTVQDGRIFILDKGYYDDMGISNKLELLAF